MILGGGSTTPARCGLKRRKGNITHEWVTLRYKVVLMSDGAGAQYFAITIEKSIRFSQNE